MKRQIEEQNESEPHRKIFTCDSLQGYMLIKEKQFWKNGRFISTPITFHRKTQDHSDPLCQDRDMFSFWEALCLEGFTFPLWKYKHNIVEYARFIDELCDLIIFEVKAASYSWITTWKEWKEWDQFLLFYLAQNTQLFRYFENHCIKLIHFVDWKLYERQSNVEAFSDSQIPQETARYFSSSAYCSEFPNFFLLTTQEREL